MLTAVLGAFLAAVTIGDFGGRWLSPMWEQRFGEGTLFLRFVVAFGGGIIMAFGARLAGAPPADTGSAAAFSWPLAPGSP